MSDWIKRGARMRCVEPFPVHGRHLSFTVPKGSESVVASTYGGLVTFVVKDPGSSGELLIKKPFAFVLAYWEYVPPPPPKERLKRPMILKSHPSFPGFSGEGRRDWPKGFIGYWAYTADPSEDAYENSEVPILLPWPEDHVDTSWDPKERDKVVEHLRSAPARGYFMGFAKCRLCGRPLGCADRYDGTYCWPDLFDHYLTDHGVKPPQEFIQHVLESLHEVP